MKQIASFIFLIYLMFSCSVKPTSEDISTIELDEGFKNEASVYLSDLVSNVEFIPLKYSDQPTHIHFASIHVSPGDEYIVYANADPQELILFDRKGNMIRKIGRRGKGPGEFLTCQVFYWDEKKDEILIADNQLMKFIKYSLQGDVIFEVSYKQYIEFGLHFISNIETNEVGDYLMFNQNPGATHFDRIVTLSSSLSYKSGILPLNQIPHRNMFLNKYDIVPLQNSHRVITPDTIWEIENSEVKPTEAILWKGESLVNISGSAKENDISIIKVLFHPFYLIISVRKENEVITLAYNMESGMVAEINSLQICGLKMNGNPGIENDLFGYSPMLPEDITISKGKWIYVIHPELVDIIGELGDDVIDCLVNKDVMLESKRDELVEIIQNFDEYSGPVLVVMNLKN